MDQLFGDSPTPPVESAHQRDRRREKPQLSCTFCRRRKMRCDRQLPCKTCVGKGIAISCTYTPGTQRQSADSVSERIKQLEALVRSLMHKKHTEKIVVESPTLNGSLRSIPSDPQGLVEEETVPSSSNMTVDPAPSPAPSEQGSMRIHSHGATYVSSFHWAAVLDSISELKHVYEVEVEERSITDVDTYVPPYNCSPRLLYEPVHATKAEILASIPTRPQVDRMIARYFNAQGIVPVILHSHQFLREYEIFWRDPTEATFAWLGLLFSIMCLSAQLLQLTEGPADAESLVRVHMFRERTVHCLVLGHFTRGGMHVLETLINHICSEVFLCKDAEIGLWLLMGIIVQLALSQGYHRDPKNFPNISLFEGEMRRRVWASVVQMDSRVSVQMGLPRLIKTQHCDTAEPLNLLDSDFDEGMAMAELPLPRPETEVTPVLYRLAKNRIDTVGGLINDLLAQTREKLYSEIMDLDGILKAAEGDLPPIFKWKPLSQSFMVSPQIVMHRVWLQLGTQRLIICLHRKYLTPSYAQDRYAYSRDACVQAAIKILQFQQLIDEEIQPGGQLYSVRWMQSSLLQFNFLLGMSVLCYYIQLAKTTPDVPLNEDMSARIYGLLRNTYPLWVRSSTMSHDARKAVEHLSIILGLRSEREDAQFVPKTTSNVVLPQNTSISVDQITWDTYQECITSFPTALGTDTLTLDTPGSSSGVSVAMTDPLLENLTELEEWIEASAK